MNSGKLLLGIIAGASIGAIAGILLAPDKGSATRKKIVDNTNDLRSLINDWATGFIENLKNAGDKNGMAETETGTGMKLNTMG